MNLNNATAESLLAELVDTGECRKWEFKDARALKDNFKLSLARQVSAFANSGGGHIALGVREVVKGEQYETDEVPQLQGTTPMKDWLARMVSTSVSYPLQEFSIHRIPFADDSQKSIFVIEIGDSPSAPHQTDIKDHKIYYWRVEDRTEQAPHFHLELLRNRMTKCVLKISETQFHVKDVIQESSHLFIAVMLRVGIVNHSAHSATSWGVQFKPLTPRSEWIRFKNDSPFFTTFSVHGSQPLLLPEETTSLVEQFHIRIPFYADFYDTQVECHRAFNSIALCMKPISQNCVGKEVYFPPQNHIESALLQSSFFSDIDSRLKRKQR